MAQEKCAVNKNEQQGNKNRGDNYSLRIIIDIFDIFNNMTQSPQKSDKQKKIQKRKKLKAFQSFLQKNQTSAGLELISNNLSEQEEKPQQLELTCCTVCKIQLGDRKKTCGFCHEPACVEHLRKKRKSKENNKFVKICDKCQDEYLFSKYMKLELKNEESIAAQETIIQSKMQEIEMQCKGRRTKLVLLYHKQNQILALKKQYDAKFNQQDNEYRQKLQKFQKKQRQLNQIQSQVKELEQKLPPSFEEDFRALEIQNDKVNSELVRLERACNEAIKTKSRRERQVYEEYRQWQQNQRKKLTKKQDQCIIF